MERFPEMELLSDSAGRRVDATAEEAVARGGLESREAVLATVSSFESGTTLARRALLRTLLREHFEALQQVGGPLPAIADYLTTFPDAAEQAVVREVFAEQLPTLRVELGREIGRGGMGVIYEARQTAVGGRRVAVKMLDVGLANQAALWNRLREEVDVLAQLPAANVVQVHDVGLINGQLAVVMELAEQNLQERTGGLPHEEREAAQIVRKLAVAVQKAHDHPRKLIHQDLKPSNVLIMPDGEAKVADFGLFHSAKNNDTPAAARVVGTPGWLAPEQVRGESPTFATDVWGLGAILYYLLTGSSPFPSKREQIDAVLSQPLPDAAARRTQAGGDELDPKLAAIVTKCLQRNPSERYNRPIRLAEDLQRYLNGEPVQAAARAAPPRPSRRRNLFAVAAAVACVAGAIPALQWALRDTPTGDGSDGTPATRPASHPASAEGDVAKRAVATQSAEEHAPVADLPKLIEGPASKPTDSPRTQPPNPETDSQEQKSGEPEPKPPANQMSPSSAPATQAAESTGSTPTKVPERVPAAVNVENYFFAREFPKGPVDCEFDLPVDDYALALLPDDVRTQVKADPTARVRESWKFEPKTDRSEPRVTFTRKLTLRFGEGAAARETTLDTRYGECTRKNLNQFFRTGRNHFIAESSFGALKNQERTLSVGPDDSGRSGKLLWKGATKNFYELSGGANNDLVVWGLVPKRD